MRAFFYGVVATAAMVASLVFFRFFKNTDERLFAFFALAFVMIGVNYTALGILDIQRETQHLFYVPRLAAFLLIIAGIADKTRR